MTTITRFAPSPSGYMHLGHIYAALTARRHADEAMGEMRLRIEDIDEGRCRAEFAQAILDDLDFMEIAWDGKIMTQSERLPAYKEALEKLKAIEAIYPCFLSRKELDSLLSAPHLPIANTDSLIAPDLAEERSAQGNQPAWRLRMQNIRPLLGDLTYTDLIEGTIPINLDSIGDEVIARKDIATSYHLAVVIDDAAQGVNLITRGHDLIASTPLHRVLQQLLELPEPKWLHHPLVLNHDGKRLAKRHQDLTIKTMRENNMTKNNILAALKHAPKSQ